MKEKHAMQRREFLAALGAAGAGMFSLPAAGEEPPPASAPSDDPLGSAAPRDIFVGVHLAAHSLYDEGFDHCLDFLQNTATVNTLLVTSNSYYGAMVRPKEVQGDHGVPIRDGRERRLTPIWFKPREKHYAQTKLRHRPPGADDEYAGREVFADLAEPARRRGMKVHERLYEPGGPAIRNRIDHGETVLTIDVFGEPGNRPCWNNPDYVEFVAAWVRDLFEQYPLDGIQYGAERSGPLSRLIDWPAAVPTCFCDHCRRRADAEGVDFDRAREGLTKVCRFVQALERGEEAGPDGALVGFLRLLMDYPEIFAWEAMHYRAGERLHRRIRDTIKQANPKAFVGRHIDHSQCSWDVFFRAAMPYSAMIAASEYLKLSTYHDILGPRLRQQIVERYGKHILREIIPNNLLALFYAVTGHDPGREPPFDALDDRGLSPEYVHREVRRAVESVAGKAAIFAGIAIDIPRGSGWGAEPWPSDPEVVYRCVRRAFDGGAAGIVVCREYEEMRAPSLRAIGRAVRDHALAARV